MMMRYLLSTLLYTYNFYLFWVVAMSYLYLKKNIEHNIANTVPSSDIKL